MAIVNNIRTEVKNLNSVVHAWKGTPEGVLH